MTLDDVRAFYSEEVQLAAPLRSRAVAEAFARVPREAFLGRGPWQIGQPDLGMGATYLTTEDGDTRHIYHNVSVALDASRHLFNGQPATIGRWIDELEIRPGDGIFHLGCGTGYYTAILSELAGPDGRVLACEVDAGLAAQAQANLAPYANVSVHGGDGAAFDPGPCDVMLINAGVTHPLPDWLQRLKEGGRIIVPLTVAFGETLGKGVVAKIVRQGERFSARVIGMVVIYSSASARDAEIEKNLGKALPTGALMKLAGVRTDEHAEEETCILHAPGVCLTR